MLYFLPRYQEDHIFYELGSIKMGTSAHGTCKYPPYDCVYYEQFVLQYVGF